MKIKHTISRMLSLVLSCVMLLQLLPVSAFASSEELSGTCGENLTWRIEDETLYIEGEGAMYDYGNIYDADGNLIETKAAPWLYAAFSHVEMDDRITHIGNEAFPGTLFESIKLPAGLKSIGDYAFASCENLKEVSLPEGLETMGYSAFQASPSLETITIPSTLKVIPNSAFWECKHLENVTIAEGVEWIESNAFADCCDIYNSEYTSLNEMPGLQRIEIPSSVKKIEDYAFANNVKLTELVLHEGLEEIGSMAFYMCNFLRELTIPSTVQTVGFDAFIIGPVDLPFLYNTPIMQENPQGLMNLYVLSKDLSIYSMALESEGKLWMMASTTIHAYEDSMIAQEIEVYNAEIPEEGLEAGFDENGNWVDAKYRISFYPLTEGAHDFSDRTSVDEENHSRSCADCDAEEVRPHTLLIDLENWSVRSCTTDGYYRWFCSACDYVGDFIYDEAIGHDLSTDYDPYDDGHEAFCYNCYEYVRVPHEWAYEADLTATEPYDVEATCAVCGYTKTITIVPEGATYVSVKAEDENGDEVTLPEDAYTVAWKDSAGNTLGEGTSYIHTQDWTVSEDNPVIAVLTFSDDIRVAYSVTETVEHTVTQLGEVAKYRLVPRDTLTVTGKVTPLLGDMTVELTTVLAGTESTQELVLDHTGAFAAEIRRTSASLTISAQGYETVQLENIQMMPAVEGVIALGTIEVGDKYATEYVTVEYTDDYSKSIAQELVRNGAQVTLVGTNGTEYDGAFIRKYPGQTNEGGYKFRILLDRDISDYFALGEQVTLQYTENDCAILPYTFTIARDGEQQTLAPELEKSLTLGISLSKPANLFVFDENDTVVYSGRNAGITLTLPKGIYTVVAYAYNNYISSIDTPGLLVAGDIPDTSYVKETIDLTADTVRIYTVPDFVLPSEVGFSVTFGTNLRVGGLIPIYVAYADNYDNGFAENIGLQLEFLEVGDLNDFPLVQVNGQYAFGADELQLTEVLGEHFINLYGSEILTVTTHQPEGVITLYARATGGDIMIRSTGKPGYTTVTLPRAYVDMNVPDSVTESEGELYLYTLLSFDEAPYTAKLYVDGELCSIVENLYFMGNGENPIPYKLNGYPDGTSVHSIQAEVLDASGEVIWCSPSYMLTLTDEENYVEPQHLDVRIEHSNVVTINGWDLSKYDFGMYVQMWPTLLNDDNTVKRDMVLDYSLTMSNPEKVANETVYMKLFGREDDPIPTINRIPLHLNPETGTFDGTYVLEANRYTEADLPYGFSFEYATLADTELSIQQTIANAEQQAESMLESITDNPFDHHDPDETEFMLQNATELSDEDREMIRTLLSIENDLHDLRAESDGSSQALAAELFGNSAVSVDPLENMTAIMGAVSGGITCESAGGITAPELQDMGYSPITASGQTLYIYQDENGYISLVDPESDLHYSFGSSMATYSRTRAADDGEGNDNFASYARPWITAVVSISQGAVDTALVTLSKIRGYYNDLMAKKMGIEDEMDNLNDYINSSRNKISNLANNPDLGKDASSSVKAAQKALDNLEEVIALNQKIDRLMSELKSLRADLSAAAGELDNLTSVMPKLRAKVAILNALDTGAFKVASFIGVDIVNTILVTIDAFEAYQAGEARHKSITTGEKFAKKAKEDMEKALQAECLKDPEGAQAQYGKCLDIYNDFKESADSAKSWNQKWFATKIGQVIGQIGSSVAGVVSKGATGIAIGVGISLAGTSAEAVCLEFYNYHYGWMVSHYDGVNFECVRPLPFEKKENCEEDEEDEDTSETPQEKPRHKNPIKPNHTHLLDPAGYVYEAVASNRVEGATAKAYYEGDNGEPVFWDDAHLHGEVNPQTTNIEGRYAWMTPIGNWLVEITKDGYLTGTSTNDPEAVNGWLPVPPPQMNVNIALVSTAAPEVISAAVAAEQAQVVFSQYMNTAQFAGGNLVTVTQNGEPISVTAVFTDAEVSPADETVYYGHVLKLTRTDGLHFSGGGIEITVSAEAENYAGNTLESAYASGALTAAQIVGSLSHSYPNRYVTDISQTEEITVQVLDTAGQPMAGVSVTARQKLGGTMIITENAVSDASGRAVFTVKGISSGYDTVIFEAGIVRTEMNTRVSPLGATAPKKPTANLSDHDVVLSGTQLVLSCATEGAVIYYTTNNTCPCTDSADRMTYTGPITLTEDSFFRIAAWTQAGGYSERLNLHIEVETIHVCAPAPVLEIGASCTSDGKEAYFACSCGKYYEDANGITEITDIEAYGIISALGHDYTEQIMDDAHVKSAAANCRELNTYWYDCSRCDSNAKDDPDAADKWYTTEAGEHDYNINAWGYREADGHAHNCNYCDAHDAVIPHTPDHEGGATEEYAIKCSVCGYELEAQLNHTHVFDRQLVDALYLKSSADCTNAALYYKSCACGEAGTETFTDGEPLGHTYGQDWKNDKNNHWHECSCGDKADIAAHEFGDDKVCDICRYRKSGSSGGGGGGTVSYRVNIVAAQKGSVSVSPEQASKGDTVTITVTPDTGCKLESLTVTDKNGSELALSKVTDTTYTFRMPASKVTVKAVFAEDSSMLNRFEDVSADAYYYDAVLWAVKQGITDGTSDTTFSPNAPCTRAQMVTFLWRAAGCPEPKSAECRFTDIDTAGYYGKAVLWAVEAGITDGTSDTTFSPEVVCTRAQMAAFLCRMAEGKAVGSSSKFTDIDSGAYYAKAVQWAVEAGITDGTSDTTFSPDDVCTRAQMVTFLYRFLGK